MNLLNTHPNYPVRLSNVDVDNDEYDNNCPFYEDTTVKRNEGIWADHSDVSTDELYERQTWKDNKLITLKEANHQFVNGKPKNQIKTGIKGRGLLGKFGPNHAADPIVTRFNIRTMDIEFVAALRNDTRPPQWCIPGGMVDAGESISVTLKREFKEEVASTCDENLLTKIFSNGKTLYTGPTYNDPRTTDDAWIETQVVHYHPSKQLVNKLKFTPQVNEVSAVNWVSCDEQNLYADHSLFVKAAKRHVKILMLKKFGLMCLKTVSLVYIVQWGVSKIVRQKQ